MLLCPVRGREGAPKDPFKAVNIREMFPWSFDFSRIPELEDPQYKQVSFCEDTPENWRRFHKLKYLIVSGLALQADPPSERQLRQAWEDLQQDPP